MAAYNALTLPWTTLNSAITALQINMSQFITQIDHFRVFTDVTQTYDITSSRPGRIVAGGNLTLRATDTLVNNNSQIIAGNLLSVTGAAITNETAQIPVTSVQNGTTLIINPAQRGNCMNTRANADCWWYVIYDQYAYNITTPRTINIDIGRVQGFTAVPNGGNVGAYSAPTTTTPTGTAGTPQAGQLTTDNTGTTALAAAQTVAATNPTNSSTDPIQTGRTIVLAFQCDRIILTFFFVCPLFQSLGTTTKIS